MENCSSGVFTEHTDPRMLAHRSLDRGIIVNDFALRQLLRRERHTVIVIEVIAEGRHPIEAPAHPLLECRELWVRRPGDRDEADVALVQMDQDRVEIIRPERAALAAFCPAGVEHEMIYDQLLLACEQLAQALLAVGSFENILLVDPHPGKLAVLGAE